MKILVAELLPNPFRDLKRYPVKEDKVEALRKSIKDTTFWDNLLVRKAPNGDGGYEIAYGHNRLAALKKERINEIDVPVRKLSDTDMAKIMSHENMEEWGSSADIEAETIRAIVKGFADGRIALPSVKADTTRGHIRLAPLFKPVSDNGDHSSREERSYSSESLAKFLGWGVSKVEDLLNVLATTEEGLIEESDTVALTHKQAAVVAREVKRINRETEDPKLAKAIGKRLAAGMHTATGRPSGQPGGDLRGARQEVTISTARRLADEMVPSHKRKQQDKAKPLPPINRFADEISMALAEAFPTPRWQDKLDAIIKYRVELGSAERRRLIGALRALAKRAENFAQKLEN
jgi:ParB-like chromosome segregation protein Spo0J